MKHSNMATPLSSVQPRRPAALGIDGCSWAGCLALLMVAACGEAPQDRTSCESDSDCQLPAVCNTAGVCAAPTPVENGKPCKHDDHCIGGVCAGPDLASARCYKGCDNVDECKRTESCAPIAGLPTSGRDAGASGALDGASDAGARAGSGRLRLVCRTAKVGGLPLGDKCSQDSECFSRLCDSGRCTQPCERCADASGCNCPLQLDCKKATIRRLSSSLEHGFCRPALVGQIELGGIDTPLTGSAPLTFQVPAGVRSFAVIAEDKNDLRVAIRELKSPKGKTLVDVDKPANPLGRGYPYIGTATALVPGSDDAQAKVVAGRYTLRLGTYDPKRLDKLVPRAGRIERVAVVYGRRRQPGLLDLQLHFSPATGLRAATASKSSYVKQMLSTMRTIYRKLFGVTLGEVRYSDLTSSEDVVADGSKARQICRTYSKPGPNQLSINVFIVDDLRFTDGFSGGIPGAPGSYRRPGSGIVVNQQSSATTMGVLLAHEVGHFLGLWHTSEKDGKRFDTISDTQQCSAGTASSKCPDRNNLMYHTFPTSNISLTLGQWTVARGSPWLYQRELPLACADGALDLTDITTSRFAGGDAPRTPSRLEGSCGDTSGGERVHLVKLAKAAASLSITARGTDFAPVVYVLRGGCEKSVSELRCAKGAIKQNIKIAIDKPVAGDYYVVVDSANGGRYTLSVDTQ